MRMIMVLTVLVLFLLTGCGLCVNGSGNVVSEEVDVSYFDAVDLRGSGILYITQQDENSLVVEAEDNIFADMDIYIEDGETLVIEQKSCVRETKPIRYRVGMNDVRENSVSGAGKIVSENEISSPDLTLAVSGSCDIDMGLRVKLLETMISGASEVSYAGTADKHVYSVSGAG